MINNRFQSFWYHLIAGASIIQILSGIGLENDHYVYIENNVIYETAHSIKLTNINCLSLR
jgi:hypothetical protein